MNTRKTIYLFVLKMICGEQLMERLLVDLICMDYRRWIMRGVTAHICPTFVCLYVCLSVSVTVSMCMSLCVYLSLSDCVSVRVSACLSLCLSVSVTFSMCVSLSVYLSVFRFGCLCLSVSHSLARVRDASIDKIRVVFEWLTFLLPGYWPGSLRLTLGQYCAQSCFRWRDPMSPSS